MFEWDEAKRLATLEKRDIDFVDMLEVFETDFLELEARSDIEFRRIAVAEIDGVCFAVVFTRREDIIRLISARRASRDERREYYARYDRRSAQDEVGD